MNNPINVLSLFDGISCGQIALARAGIKVNNYYASEIDKYAIKVTQHNFPNTLQLGDVTSVDVKKLPKIDLLIGGSPCFVAGTKVQTTEGLKSIEDIKIGDRVITHTNTYKEVLNIGGSIGKETYVVKAQGMIPTTTTYNHPYYVRSKSKDVLSSPTWKQAGEMVKGDYVGFPINRISENPLNLTEDECLVIGRYIADGHTRKDFRKEEGREEHRYWQLILSIGEDKVVGFSNKYKLPHSMYKHTQSTNRAVFSSKRLVEIVEEHCGTRSDSKVFGQMLLNLPIHLLSKVFEGYSDGDGCNTNQGWQATTVSKDLALSLSQAIAKITGRGCNVTFCVRPKTRIIEGRTVNQKDTYLVRINSSDKHAWIKDNDIIWYPVKTVTKTGINEVVYNIEVAEDNSYTANNFIVHNCQGFSFAGKNLNFDDPRSQLFFQYVRILNDIREYNSDVKFLLENVKMKIASQNVISEALGVEPIEINSALVSAQNRKRLYWTNIENITQPEDKNIKLADIIETSNTLTKKKVEISYLKDGVFAAALRGRPNNDGKNIQKFQTSFLEKSNALTTVQTVSLLLFITDKEVYFRTLTRLEAERLQTLPENYTSSISKTQAMDKIGNGWTVDVVAHIFSYLKTT